MTQKTKKTTTIRNRHSRLTSLKPQPTTLLGHLYELQMRLVAVAVVFVGISALAYPFFGSISKLITAPLNGHQELVYLTPGGAITFVIKVCLYVGLIGSLPVIIYNLYQFLMPVVRPAHMKTVLTYTFASLSLAIIGVMFTYFVSLPAALYFLTSFNLSDINPMLTVDSYFSFVMTYLLAGALLFQVPLIILLINSIKPLTPKRMMGLQRHVILVSFIVAAIITPTPDPLNQTLIASPMIIMYQLGILLVWLKNRRHKQAMITPKATDIATAIDRQATVQPVPSRPSLHARLIGDVVKPVTVEQKTVKTVIQPQQMLRQTHNIDGIKRMQRNAERPLRPRVVARPAIQDIKSPIRTTTLSNNGRQIPRLGGQSPGLIPRHGQLIQL